MSKNPPSEMHSAFDCVISCSRLEAAQDFYTTQLGFRLDAIYPADNPGVALLSGYGGQVRLVAPDGDAGFLQCPDEVPSPTKVQAAVAEEDVVVRAQVYLTVYAGRTGFLFGRRWDMVGSSNSGEFIS